MTKRFGLALVLFAAAFSCRSGSSQSTVRSNDNAQSSGYIWTQLTEHAAFPPGYNFPVYVAKGKMWAMHAEGIWSSSNGQVWTREQLPSIRRNVYQTDYVLFNDAVFALGDNTGNFEAIRFRPRVRRTNDFRRWEILSERSNLPGRIFRGVGVFNGKIWLLGGFDGKNYYNDVWNSGDGVTWTRITEHAAWSPRTVGQPFVFRDRMYIIGGGVIDGATEINPASAREVWSTVDGKDWVKTLGEMPMIAGGAPVVFDDKLWLVGANRDGSFGRSSMVSSDAVDWIEHRAPWSPRGGAAAWVMGDKLYMTGGKYSVTENGEIRFMYSNDVWVMSKK
jgi:hypothetical protein